jgi:WD40 repeat protein
LTGLWEELIANRGRVLGRQRTAVTSLAWSPDGKTLASGGGDENIYLWDARTPNKPRRLDARGAVAWSPDGKTLAVGRRGSPISLWDPVAGKQIRTLSGFGDSSLAWSPDGKRLASITGKTICLWDVATGKEIGHCDGHYSDISSVSWSPDSKRVASASWDGTIRVWNPTTGKQIHGIKAARGYIDSLAWSPDGKMLAAGGEDDNGSLAKDTWIRLLNPATGQQVSQVARLDHSVFSLAWSPDGKTLASGSEDNKIRLWNVVSGTAFRQLDGKPGRCQRMAWSPDGKILAWAGTEDMKDSEGAVNTVRMADIATEKILYTHTHPEAVRWLGWRAEGRTLLSASADKHIRLWDVAAHREIRRFIGHDAPVSSVACSPDGKTLASSSEDGTVRLWETATGKEVHRWQVTGPLHQALFWSPDGTRLASTCALTIVIWPIWHHADEPPVHLTALELKTCWNALASHDSLKAHQAINTLIRGAEDSVPFLAKQLKLASRPNLKHVSRLIAELDDQRYSTREKTTAELARLEEFAEPALRQALKRTLPLEHHLRVERLLSKLEVWSSEQLRGLRATTALETIASPEARELLRVLAKGAPEARLTREAKASLQRLSRGGR